MNAPAAPDLTPFRIPRHPTSGEPLGSFAACSGLAPVEAGGLILNASETAWLREVLSRIKTAAIMTEPHYASGLIGDYPEENRRRQAHEDSARRQLGEFLARERVAPVETREDPEGGSSHLDARVRFHATMTVVHGGLPPAPVR